jgi:glycine cleavage system H protein
MVKEYSDNHLWMEREDDGTMTVGLSKKAKDEIGEIVYIQLPKVDKFYKKDEDVCVIESTKSALDLCNPIEGTIVDVNSDLESNLELINIFPEDKGWIYKIQKK